MKNRFWAVCTFTILLILCVVAKPGTAEETTGVIDAQSAFEKLKGMVGEWKGTVQDKSAGPVVEVRYKLTAHRTAMFETFTVAEKRGLKPLLHQPDPLVRSLERIFLLRVLHELYRSQVNGTLFGKIDVEYKFCRQIILVI